MSLFPWFCSVSTKRHGKTQKLITAICWKHWQPSEYTTLCRSPLYMTEFVIRKLICRITVHLQQRQYTNRIMLEILNYIQESISGVLMFSCRQIHHLLSNIRNTLPIQPQLLQSCRSFFLSLWTPFKWHDWQWWLVFIPCIHTLVDTTTTTPGLCGHPIRFAHLHAAILPASFV